MTNDPSFLDAERLVRFYKDRSQTYAVMLSSGEGSIVQAIKKRPSGGTYRSTIKPDSQNWKRCVRLARMAKANHLCMGQLMVDGVTVHYLSNDI